MRKIVKSLIVVACLFVILGSVAPAEGPLGPGDIIRLKSNNPKSIIVYAVFNPDCSNGSFWQGVFRPDCDVARMTDDYLATITAKPYNSNDKEYSLKFLVNSRYRVVTEDGKIGWVFSSQFELVKKVWHPFQFQR